MASAQSVHDSSNPPASFGFAYKVELILTSRLTFSVSSSPIGLAKSPLISSGWSSLTTIAHPFHLPPRPGRQNCPCVRPRVTAISYISLLRASVVWPGIVSRSEESSRVKCAQRTRLIAQSAGKSISSMLHSATHIIHRFSSAPTAQSFFEMICETASAPVPSAQIV